MRVAPSRSYVQCRCLRPIPLLFLGADCVAQHFCAADAAIGKTFLRIFGTRSRESFTKTAAAVLMADHPLATELIACFEACTSWRGVPQIIQQLTSSYPSHCNREHNPGVLTDEVSCRPCPCACTCANPACAVRICPCLDCMLSGSCRQRLCLCLCFEEISGGAPLLVLCAGREGVPPLLG